MNILCIYILHIRIALYHHPISRKTQLITENNYRKICTHSTANKSLSNFYLIFNNQ